MQVKSESDLFNHQVLNNELQSKLQQQKSANHQAIV